MSAAEERVPHLPEPDYRLVSLLLALYAHLDPVVAEYKLRDFASRSMHPEAYAAAADLLRDNQARQERDHLETAEGAVTLHRQLEQLRKEGAS